MPREVSCRPGDLAKSCLGQNWKIMVRGSAELAVAKIRGDTLQGTADVLKMVNF
jgi:hypothetical protein